jgi:hypothetical protein
MATSKKPVPLAAAKEARPVKASASVKPQLVAVAELASPVAKDKAPAVKKVAAKALAKVAPAPVAAPAKAAAPAKVAAKKKAAVGTVWHEVDPEKRANYIEVAAFYIAERRGFTPGNPEQDYLDAAAEIDQLIAAGHFAK